MGPARFTVLLRTLQQPKTNSNEKKKVLINLKVTSEQSKPSLPSFPHVLTCTRPLRALAGRSHREKTLDSKRPPALWRRTTKPELTDELCVSKRSGQRELTETFESLSAITGIIFNHYHGPETHRRVLKLIMLCSQHNIDSHWVTDPRWFI